MATSSSHVFRCDANFCPECGAILPLPGLKDVVTCKVCKFQKDTKEFEGIEIYSKKVFNVFKPKKAVEEKDEQENDPLAGPMVDQKCSKCGHEGLTFLTRQTRSADEGQTVFFCCPRCGFQETEYS